MRLKDLIEKTEHRGVSFFSFEDAEVTGISCDSRSIERGNLFAALKGEHADGRDFAVEAARKGASCVLCEAPVKNVNVPQVIVPDVNEALAKLSVRFYREPSKGMNLVGITGTNGKTTVVYLVESIFKEAGINHGVISTVNYRYSGKTLPAPFTTPRAHDLQMILREMKDAGVTHCIMEVSSHSLAQKRIDGCRFAVRVFTNLSPEHLDYHHTMEEYFNAKARLFTDTTLEAEGGVSVVNVDDEWGEELAGRLEDPLSYSIVCDRRRSRIYPGDFSLSAEGIVARVKTPGGTVEVRSPLVGEYNLYNIMAAVAVGFAAGIEAPLISRGINALKSVPGRLEMVTKTGLPAGPGRFKAYVDYAHTPDALERVLSALRAVREGRIITVFGCGGNRDRKKRPLMGEVSARLSDVTIVTSDNPRDEEPLDIIKEIEAGVKGVKGVKRYDPEKAIEEKGYTVIPERAEAITKAVSLARPGDTVLIAGKGHEDYQIVKGKRLRFDDREVLKKVIAHRAAGVQGAGLK